VDHYSPNLFIMLWCDMSHIYSHTNKYRKPQFIIFSGFIYWSIKSHILNHIISYIRPENLYLVLDCSGPQKSHIFFHKFSFLKSQLLLWICHNYMLWCDMSHINSHINKYRKPHFIIFSDFIYWSIKSHILNHIISYIVFGL
jgi:hypothetical protein